MPCKLFKVSLSALVAAYTHMYAISAAVYLIESVVHRLVSLDYASLQYKNAVRLSFSEPIESVLV